MDYFLISNKFYMFVGDAGYPLEPWLMTPLPHYPEWSQQHHYNKKLCKACCLGINEI